MQGNGYAFKTRGVSLLCPKPGNVMWNFFFFFFSFNLSNNNLKESQLTFPSIVGSCVLLISQWKIDTTKICFNVSWLVEQAHGRKIDHLKQINH